MIEQPGPAFSAEVPFAEGLAQRRFRTEMKELGIVARFMDYTGRSVMSISLLKMQCIFSLLKMQCIGQD